eukprot:TRINITY_DN7057_c0_g2_i1.p1 TRINITY_DN7057_c0_g2~~TRINITY_DN7057_c0_g2_i1.p1  ORF type:complete len:1484 (+),score=405.09 TRINITY_DN7057_c0_g2_i1:566-5017(+)
MPATSSSKVVLAPVHETDGNLTASLKHTEKGEDAGTILSYDKSENLTASEIKKEASVTSNQVKLECETNKSTVDCLKNTHPNLKTVIVIDDNPEKLNVSSHNQSETTAAEPNMPVTSSQHESHHQVDAPSTCREGQAAKSALVSDLKSENLPSSSELIEGNTIDKETVSDNETTRFTVDVTCDILITDDNKKSKQDAYSNKRSVTTPSSSYKPETSFQTAASCHQNPPFSTCSVKAKDTEASFPSNSRIETLAVPPENRKETKATDPYVSSKHERNETRWGDLLETEGTICSVINSEDIQGKHDISDDQATLTATQICKQFLNHLPENERNTCTSSINVEAEQAAGSRDSSCPQVEVMTLPTTSRNEAHAIIPHVSNDEQTNSAFDHSEESASIASLFVTHENLQVKHDCFSDKQSDMTLNVSCEEVTYPVKEITECDIVTVPSQSKSCETEGDTTTQLVLCDNEGIRATVGNPEQIKNILSSDFTSDDKKVTGAVCLDKQAVKILDTGICVSSSANEVCDNISSPSRPVEKEEVVKTLISTATDSAVLAVPFESKNEANTAPGSVSPHNEETRSTVDNPELKRLIDSGDTSGDVRPKDHVDSDDQSVMTFIGRNDMKTPCTQLEKQEINQADNPPEGKSEASTINQQVKNGLTLEEEAILIVSGSCKGLLNSINEDSGQMTQDENVGLIPPSDKKFEVATIPSEITKEMNKSDQRLPSDNEVECTVVISEKEKNILNAYAYGSNMQENNEDDDTLHLSNTISDELAVPSGMDKQIDMSRALSDNEQDKLADHDSEERELKLNSGDAVGTLHWEEHHLDNPSVMTDTVSCKGLSRNVSEIGSYCMPMSVTEKHQDIEPQLPPENKAEDLVSPTEILKKGDTSSKQVLSDHEIPSVNDLEKTNDLMNLTFSGEGVAENCTLSSAHQTIIPLSLMGQKNDNVLERETNGHSSEKPMGQECSAVQTQQNLDDRLDRVHIHLKSVAVLSESGPSGDEMSQKETYTGSTVMSQTMSPKFLDGGGLLEKEVIQDSDQYAMDVAIETSMTDNNMLEKRDIKVPNIQFDHNSLNRGNILIVEPLGAMECKDTTIFQNAQEPHTLPSHGQVLEVPCQTPVGSHIQADDLRSVSQQSKATNSFSNHIDDKSKLRNLDAGVSSKQLPETLCPTVTDERNMKQDAHLSVEQEAVPTTDLNDDIDPKLPEKQNNGHVCQQSNEKVCLLTVSNQKQSSLAGCLDDSSNLSILEKHDVSVADQHLLPTVSLRVSRGTCILNSPDPLQLDTEIGNKASRINDDMLREKGVDELEVDVEKSDCQVYRTPSAIVLQSENNAVEDCLKSNCQINSLNDQDFLRKETQNEKINNASLNEVNISYARDSQLASSPVRESEEVNVSYAPASQLASIPGRESEKDSCEQNLTESCDFGKPPPRDCEDQAMEHQKSHNYHSGSLDTFQEDDITCKGVKLPAVEIITDKNPHSLNKVSPESSNSEDVC